MSQRDGLFGQLPGQPVSPLLEGDSGNSGRALAGLPTGFRRVGC
jgi:hypothetical protein